MGTRGVFSLVVGRILLFNTRYCDGNNTVRYVVSYFSIVQYMYDKDFYHIVLHADMDGRHLKQDRGTFTISFTENPLI